MTSVAGVRASPSNAVARAPRRARCDMRWPDRESPRPCTRPDAGRETHSWRRRRGRCADARGRRRRANHRAARCTGDRGATGISSSPRAAGVEQDPVAVRRMERNGVALADVDHVELDVSGHRRRERSPGDQRRARNGNQRRAMPLRGRAGDDHGQGEHRAQHDDGVRRRDGGRRAGHCRREGRQTIQRREQRVHRVGDEMRDRRHR